MKNINYKSDFEVRLNLTDLSGNHVDFPDCDWEALFWASSRVNAFAASCREGVYTNCYLADDGVHVVFNNHGLGTGTLRWEPHFFFPNGVFPDGVQDIYRPEALDITLVADAGDSPTQSEVQAMIPYVKGDAFTYDDFTPEQIAALQQPAEDAARRVDTYLATANADEQQRVSAEQDRLAAEIARNNAEQARIAAEAERVAAEQARADEFAEWGESIGGGGGGEGGNSKQLFIDQWNAAWTAGGVAYGKYDPDNAPDTDHPFMGNEIWMTYDEAVNVMLVAPLCIGRNYKEYMFAGNTNIRTLCPMTLGENIYQISLLNAFRSCTNLEAVRFWDNGNTLDTQKLRAKSCRSMFCGCGKLKHTYGGINIGYWNERESPWHAFEKCYALESVNLRGLKIDFYLKDSPLLSFESFEYLVQYSANGTTAITVTVHPDVYAKMTADTTNEAAAALTEDELARWQALVTTAAERNITFATA